MMKKLLTVSALLAAIIAPIAYSTQEKPAVVPGVEQRLEVATFAGGCFWCVESDFDKVPGVVKTISGFTGGQTERPSYEQVSSGVTGHFESVQVHYDPKRVSYEGLLAAFWRMIDPTDSGGQFVDRGQQYTTAIFYHNDAQKMAAEKSRGALAASGRHTRPLVTVIRPAGMFYPAEDYHQDFHTKSPLRYNFYRHRSGRDQYLEKTWGKDLKVDYSQYMPEKQSMNMNQKRDYQKPPDEVLRKKLTRLQYDVTRHEATEPPFENEYWDEKHAGIYVDIASGEPLFSSTDKFDSGTGWPSFTKPLQKENIVEKRDFRLILPRTEVRSRHGDSHLGHVFKDGPAPTGLRYCINSAALRFIPTENLEKEGYGEYLPLFK